MSFYFKHHFKAYLKFLFSPGLLDRKREKISLPFHLLEAGFLQHQQHQWWKDSIVSENQIPFIGWSFLMFGAGRGAGRAAGIVPSGRTLNISFLIPDVHDQTLESLQHAQIVSLLS